MRCPFRVGRNSSGAITDYDCITSDCQLWIERENLAICSFVAIAYVAFAVARTGR